MKTPLKAPIVTTLFATVLSILALMPYSVFGQVSSVSVLNITPNAVAPVENRFIVGPAKLEATVPAGETSVVNVDLENRTGRTEVYTFGFEDVVASDKPGEVVALVEDGSKVQTSLASDLSVPQDEVALSQGDRVRVPVSISIPSSATPGGLYGALVVSAHAEDASTGNSASAVVVGRAAALIFVTVPGNVTEDGMVKSFSIAEGKKVFFGSDVPFEIAFRNDGNVNLNPYGGITIRTMFGSVVSETPIDPWFVLPGATRTRDIAIATKHLTGIFHATLEENRGYGDAVDTKEVTFVAISPETLVLLGIVIIVLAMLVRKMRAIRSRRIGSNGEESFR